VLEQDGDLYCRWHTDYQVATDRLITQFSVRTGTPFAEHRVNHFILAYRYFALVVYHNQIEECKRRARAQPGEQFSFDFGVNRDEILAWQRPRRPNYETLFGYMYASPAWAELAQEDHLGVHEKSIELLRSWLDGGQLVEYNEHKHFTVIGSDTGTLYRLIETRSYNILELDSTHQPTGQKFCVVPGTSVAMGDQLLAQKIWIETDERATLKIANKIARVGNWPWNAEMHREAIPLFTESNAFLQRYREEFGTPEARLGSQLRIRLPADVQLLPSAVEPPREVDSAAWTGRSGRS
jgi:hypothetical protein